MAKHNPEMEWVETKNLEEEICHDLMYKGSIVGIVFEVDLDGDGDKTWFWSLTFHIFDALNIQSAFFEEIIENYFGTNPISSVEEGKKCCYKTVQEVLKEYGMDRNN